MATKPNPQIAELLLAVGALMAENKKLQSDVVALKQQPVEATSPDTAHLRCIDDIYFSVTRPLMAVFIDRDAAFDYRASLARERKGQPVRVETVLGHDRTTVVDLVY